MALVNVTELRGLLPDYLKQVQAGEETVITLHGKIITRIVPYRLDALRGTVNVGGILAPAVRASN